MAALSRPSQWPQWPFYHQEAATWQDLWIRAADGRFPIVPYKQFINGQVKPFLEKAGKASVCFIRPASRSGRLIKAKDQEPLPQKIYSGVRLHLTRNVNKGMDFVNGMEATVRSLDAASGCLRVTTATGKGLALFPLTETSRDKLQGA